MRSFAPLLLFPVLMGTLAAMAPPPDEAEAYRLDRIETRKLNDAERDTLALSVQKPKAPAVTPTPQPPATDEEQALRLREEQALDTWRRRGTACRAGNRGSCDPR